jgi:hypothetical protein
MKEGHHLTLDINNLCMLGPDSFPDEIDVFDMNSVLDYFRNEFLDINIT